MSQQWYFVRNQEREGPISLERLLEALRAASPEDELLVWKEGMDSWQSPQTIPELQAAMAAPLAQVEATTADQGNPYAPPENTTAQPHDALRPVGNFPLNWELCLQTGWNFTRAHLGKLLGLGLLYLGITIGFELISGMALSISGVAFGQEPNTSLQFLIYFVGQILSAILSTYLGIGVIIFSLHLLKGQSAEISDLFQGGSLLLRTILAGLLYAAMVIGGLLLLVLPGIYLAIRFGQYQYALVERDLGPLEALEASWKMTKGNVLNLFVLGILSFFIVLAGFLALLAGLIWAYPTVLLASTAAYLMMTYGRPNLEKPSEPGDSQVLI